MLKHVSQIGGMLVVLLGVLLVSLPEGTNQART